jgi:hypothetical protein
MPLGRRRSGGESAEETLLRVRSRLEGYQSMGRSRGGSADVSVDHVIDLLDPRGTWRFAREKAKAEPPEAPGPDPGADPMTGCRPVV